MRMADRQLAAWCRAAAGMMALLADGCGSSQSSSTPSHEEWNCAWDPQMLPDRVEPILVLRVFVGSDGRPRDVEILQDAGFGVGEAIRQCALARRYYIRDENGQLVEGWSPPIKMHLAR
jgi:hypothetical protein